MGGVHGLLQLCVRFGLDLRHRLPSANRDISNYALWRMDEGLFRERAKEELVAAFAARQLGVPLWNLTVVNNVVVVLAEALWAAFQAATLLKHVKAWKVAVP